MLGKTTGTADKVVLIGALMLIAPALAGCADLGGDGTASIFVKDSHIDDFETIEVTFSKVSIHQGEAEDGDGGEQPDTDGAGWITAFEGTKTIDLLSFDSADARAFLGQANLSAGVYNQIVVEVDEAVGTRSDGSTETFTVTTGWFRIVRAWEVTAGEDIRLIIDLDLERSITQQGDQGYRFNPVIGQVLTQPNSDGSTRSVSDSGDGGTGGEGEMTTYVKDTPQQNFTEVWVRISQVEVHAASNESWVTVVDETRDVDLLSFDEPNAKAFLGDAVLDAGRYTQIRLYIDEAWGFNGTGDRINITVVNSPGFVVRTFNITDGDLTQVVIDVNLTQSLHRSGGGGDGGGTGQGGQDGNEWQLTPNIGRVIVQEGLDDDPRADQADQDT